MSSLNFLILAFCINFRPLKKDVNVARFAGNVKCDFLGDFQTLCKVSTRVLKHFSIFYTSKGFSYSQVIMVCELPEFWILEDIGMHVPRFL